MSDSEESTVAQVCLRDLLFYVLPGSIIILGVGALAGVMPADLRDYAGLAPSVAGLLLAYAFGQCAYPLAYLIRYAMEKLQKEKKDVPLFRLAYRSAPTEAPVFFSVEVFRYRTMARFCSVMAAPVLFSTLAIIHGQWDLEERWKIVTVITGLSIVIGFLYRYHRYEARYRSAVMELARPKTKRGLGEEEP